MSKPPLWQVMQDAVIAAPAPARSPAGATAAAQIRALRDWLVPEEALGLRPPTDGGLIAGVEWCVGKERQRLRALLTAKPTARRGVTMADHSPVTRAMVAAFNARYELCGPFDDNWQELCLAAALRALAEHRTTPDSTSRGELHRIAAELEGQQSTSSTH